MIIMLMMLKAMRGWLIFARLGINVVNPFETSLRLQIISLFVLKSSVITRWADSTEQYLNMTPLLHPYLIGFFTH